MYFIRQYKGKISFETKIQPLESNYVRPLRELGVLFSIPRSENLKETGVTFDWLDLSFARLQSQDKPRLLQPLSHSHGGQQLAFLEFRKVKRQEAGKHREGREWKKANSVIIVKYFFVGIVSIIQHHFIFKSEVRLERKIRLEIL